MEIKMNKNADKLIVEVIGRLDTLTSPELESKLSPELDGIKDLVLDFKDLDYISSAGLRVLLGLAQSIEGRGTMTVKNPNVAVMDVFDVTGFSDILNIE